MATELDERTDYRVERRTTARLYLIAVGAVVLLVLLVAWVVANRQRVDVDWLFASTSASLALIIFVAAAVGWMLGMLTPFAIRFRARHRR